jgi:DNA-binding transcriptional LysR family regulator
MDVHLRNLRYFVAVAEELHFSRAAERLHVSQPALSKQIRQLEQQLHFPLFRRDRRRVQLTAAGEALLPRARRLLAAWDVSLAEAGARASEEAKLLRVGFQTSVAGGLYQAVVARFGELHPDWRLELRMQPWTDTTGGLLDRSSDVAFVWLPTGADDVIEVRPVRTERRFVALPARHRLARRKALQMADLLDQPFIALPEESGVLRDYWLALDERGGRPARIGAEVATPDETWEAVASGRGVHLMAEGAAAVYARPGIVCRPVIDLAPCAFAVAWRRDERRAVVHELVRVAMDVAAEVDVEDAQSEVVA